MRINVYAEEQTSEFKLVEKVADTGAHFFGVRFFLKSSEALHHRIGDDDRSAITFWIPSGKAGHREGDGDALAAVFERAAAAIYNAGKRGEEEEEPAS